MARMVRFTGSPSKTSSKPPTPTQTTSSPSTPRLAKELSNLSLDGKIHVSGARGVNIKAGSGDLSVDTMANRNTHTRVFGRGHDRAKSVEEIPPYLSPDLFTYSEVEATLSHTLTAFDSASSLDTASILTDDRKSEKQSFRDLFTMYSSNNSDLGSISSSLEDFEDELGLGKLSFSKKYEKNAIYVSLLIFNEKKQLVLNSKGTLPSIQLFSSSDDGAELMEEFQSNSEPFIWAKQTSQDWEPWIKDVDDLTNPSALNIQALMDRYHQVKGNSKSKNKFRKGYFRAIMAFHKIFQLRNMGYMYEAPIFLNHGKTIVLLHLIYMDKKVMDPVMKTVKFAWCQSIDLNPSVYLMDEYNSLWGSYFKVYARYSRALKPGLYLTLCEVNVSVDGLHFLASKHYTSLPPIAKIQDNIDLAPGDLMVLDQLQQGLPKDSPFDSPFTTRFEKALAELYEVTGLKEDRQRCLIRAVPFSLDNGVNILVMARLNDLGTTFTFNNEQFDMIPLSLFEVLHFNRYLGEDNIQYKRTMRKLLHAESVTSSLSKDFAITTDIQGQIKKCQSDWNRKRWTRTTMDTIRSSTPGVERDQSVKRFDSLTSFDS